MIMLNVASYILLEPYAPSGLIWIPVLLFLVLGIGTAVTALSIRL